MNDDLLSDRHLDDMVRTLRRPTPHTTRSWRQTQRSMLVDHIGTDVGADADRGVIDGVHDVALGRFDHGPDRHRRRTIGVAAALLVTIGVAAIWQVSSPSSSEQVPSGPTPKVTTRISVSENTIAADLSGLDAITQAEAMVSPGESISPEMRGLLALPGCQSSDGLGEWTVEQLSWLASFSANSVSETAADFADVTKVIATDTGATSARCTSAIAYGPALTWGLGDGAGNWIARGTGIPDPGEFEWPELEREKQGDDGTGGLLGNGQYFNDFNVRTTALEPTAAGVITSGPVLVVEFAEEVPLDASPNRLWYLRTSEPVTDTVDVSPISPEFQPTLVPEGFDRCSWEYGIESGDVSMVATDYCDENSTVTATFGFNTAGEAAEFGGLSLLVERPDEDTVVVAVAGQGPRVIAPFSIPIDQLATMVVSIPTAQPITDPPAIDTTGYDDAVARDVANNLGAKSVVEQLYVLQEGDGANVVAETFGIDAEQLVEHNGGRESWPRPGSVVTMPPGAVVREDAIQVVATFPLVGRADHAIGVFGGAEGVCLLGPGLETFGCDELVATATSGPIGAGVVLSAQLTDGATIVYGLVDPSVEVVVEAGGETLQIPVVDSELHVSAFGFVPDTDLIPFGEVESGRADVVLRSRLDGRELDRSPIEF